MQLTNVVLTIIHWLKRCFHKRNVIIVSEDKVHYLPIAGWIQFSLLALTLTGLWWVSYSTGNYLSVRIALYEQSQVVKKQTQVLRSVANMGAQRNLNSLLQMAQPEEHMIPGVLGQTAAAFRLSKEPMATLSALDESKVFAKVATLENKINELQATNEIIVERVREKVAGRIDDLEGIIKKTGLSPATLKKEADKSTKDSGRFKSEGGPYIPSSMIHLTTGAEDMFSEIDELAVWRQILAGIPLSEPVRNADEQSPFGYRIDPFNEHLAFHSGLDLVGPLGSRVHSTANGTVISSGRNGAYGNAVDIDHGFGITTRYGHLSEILVRDGQKIRKGDVIGVQGSTGRSTGPHVHYEVRYHDRAMNPKNFLNAGRQLSQD